MRVIDGDGHVMEDWQGLLEYMPEPYRKIGRFRGRIFPPLDHLHSGTLYRVVPGAFRPVGFDGWLEFMDDVGIERAVLYTTEGLAFGKVIDSEFAVDVARAYNNGSPDLPRQKPPIPRVGTNSVAGTGRSGEGITPRRN